MPNSSDLGATKTASTKPKSNSTSCGWLSRIAVRVLCTTRHAHTAPNHLDKLHEIIGIHTLLNS